MALRLRCLHSCVLALVVGLLLVYSTFLTSPVPQQMRLLLSGVSSSLQSDNGASSSGETSLNLTSSSTLSSSSPPSSSQSPVETRSNTSSKTPPSLEAGKLFSAMPASPLTAVAAPSAASSHAAVISGSNKPPANVTVAPKGDAVLSKDIYEGGHRIPAEGLCPSKGENVKVVILITSAPSHSQARSAIRMTWGHFGHRSDIALAFLVGRVANVQTQLGMEKESLMYGDIIQGNFMDSYDNLTLKTISMFEWMREYCPLAKYVLKTDDDMFIHVPNLLAFVDSHRKDTRRIYGRLAQKWKPVRNRKSKYYVSAAQYKPSVYPDFTTGPAYLLTTDTVDDLYRASLDRRYFKLEDVYTTGIVAQSLKIQRSHVEAFSNKRISLSPCKLNRVISVHMIQFHEQFDIWKKLQDGKTKC